MEKIRLSEIYHEETKYHEAKMGKYQRQLDWNAQPLPYKEYHSEKKVPLIPYLPFQNNPLTGEPLTPAREEVGYPIGRDEISRLLYFTNGVTGILQYITGGKLFLRAAPTAGGLYPTEIYVAIRDLSALENGIYNFQARDHCLSPVWEGNFWSEFESYCMQHEAIAQAHLLIIMTAVYQRSAWRYQERAYRRILLDTGHVIGNLTAYAPHEGFSPCPIGGFFDAALNRLLFLDESQEGVLAVIALPQSGKVNPDGIRQTSPGSSRKSVPEERPLQLQLHAASSIVPDETTGEGAWETLPTFDFLESRHPMQPTLSLTHTLTDLGEEDLTQTILRRRSTRAYTGGAFSPTQVSSLLSYAYAPFSSRRHSLFAPSILETYVILQNVDEWHEGVYYYAPRSLSLRLLAAGDFRPQSWHFCLGQEIARDAAAIVIHVAHLKMALEQYGDRAYRYLHMDAGQIGQRLNLAAVHLGLGASGIGGFYDDEVNALLGLSLDHIVVYITTLGVPQE